MIDAAGATGRRTERAPARRDTVDFWRGFVLCTIFVNHVPGNVFERLTYRNFGLSDSAEAFVFISGVALALAYGRQFAAGAVESAVWSLGRRAARLYAVHLALSLLGVAIFAAGAVYFADDSLMEAHGRDLVVDDPWAALVGLVSLGHQFGYFNILPLYVLLVAFAPVLFLLTRVGPGVMLGTSFALYAATRLTGLNIPTWPMRGDWFLDPFAWQLLLAIGIACGGALGRPVRAPNRALMVLSAMIVVVGVVLATDAFGLRPGLFDDARRWGDLDKTVLGLGRLVHFMALAYLVAGLKLADRLRRTPVFQPLRLIGRNGLMSFVLLSLLAASGQVLTLALGHTIGLDLLIVGGGLAGLYGVARLTSLRDIAPVLGPEVFAAVRSGGRTTL